MMVVCLCGALIAAPAPLAQKKQSAPTQKRQPEAPPPAPTTQEQPSIFPRYRVGVTEVVVAVTVTSESGEFVLDLQPEDFRLLDNDVQQQIRVELTELPLSLVILLSTSVKIEPLLPQVRKVGNLFTNLVMGENGEAAAITFDHRVEVTQNFTRDPEALEKVFKDLKEGSEQARLSDAIVRALSMLSTRPKERRKAILVIAEARDNGSETDLGYALREAQIGGISIYTVGLSSTRSNLTRKPPPPAPSPFPPGAGTTRPGIPPTPTAAAQTSGNVNLLNVLTEAVRGVKGMFFDNPLEAYAKGTGAVHLDGFSKGAVERAVSQIGRELHSQYLVTYRPNNLNQSGFHRILVTVNRPGAKARTRPGYFYPGGAESSPAESAPKP